MVSRLDALAAASFSVPEDVCPDDAAAFARRTELSELRVRYFVDLGPNSGYLGELPVQMVDAGRWLLTGSRSGTVSAAAEPPRQCWVLQKVVVSLDHLPVAAVGAVVPVTGRLVVYTRDGVPTPIAGRRVELMTTNFDGDDQQSIGTAVTDA